MEGGALGLLLGCSKCRYAQKGCGRCRDPGFQERQRTREPRKRHTDDGGASKAAQRGHQEKKRRVGAGTAAQQDCGGNALDHRGAAMAQDIAGTGSRRLLRSGSSGQRQGSDDAAKCTPPSQHAHDSGAAVAPSEEPAEDSTASDEASEQCRSGLEMGFAAGMLPLPKDALQAGPPPPAPLYRRYFSRSNTSGYELVSDLYQRPEQVFIPPEPEQPSEDSGPDEALEFETLSFGVEMDFEDADGLLPRAALHAGPPQRIPLLRRLSRSKASGHDVVGEVYWPQEACAAPEQGDAAEPDLAAASAEAEDLRRISFLDLLHSTMAQRREQRRAGRAELGGPTLAAALATGARQKKV